jgi:hypothetical protein
VVGSINFALLPMLDFGIGGVGILVRERNYRSEDLLPSAIRTSTDLSFRSSCTEQNKRHFV